MRSGLLILLLSLAPAAEAKGLLEDRPGQSRQLQALIPEAPKGWDLKSSTLGASPSSMAFPWATTLYLKPGAMVSLSILAGVQNRTFQQVQQALDDPGLAAANGLTIHKLKGRSFVTQAKANGKVTLFLNVGRTATVLIDAPDLETAEAFLKLVKLSALEALTQ